jgi:hypothetical protein
VEPWSAARFVPFSDDARHDGSHALADLPAVLAC